MKKLYSDHKQRNSAVEILRILAMIMILFSHFSNYSGFAFDPLSITLPRLWYNLISMSGKTGAAIYVLISGYFLVSDKNTSFNIKKILKLIGHIEFYSVAIYFIAIVFKLTSFSVKGVISAFFPITFVHWWFASSYFVLFLLHPFINRLLAAINKNTYKNLLILLVIMWCIIPTFFNQTYQGSDFLWMVMLYCIAGYIRLYGTDFRLTQKNYTLIFIISFALTYLSTATFTVLGTKWSFFADYIQFFSRQVSILVIINSVSLFMIAIKAAPFNSKAINILSSATFGVYLIHESVYLRPIIWKTLFHGTEYSGSVHLIGYSILAVISVYVCCSLIDIIRNYTIAKPYNKFINSYAGRIIHPIKQLVEKF